MFLKKIKKRKRPGLSDSVRLLLLLWVTLSLGWMGCSSEPLPNFGQVQAFSLQGSEGSAFGSEELTGKVWVASFFFTRCKTICPKLLGFLSQVDERAKKEELNLHLVSITVDPEHDTPEVLRKKAKEIQAGKNWHFLTGLPEEIRTVVVNGFKTHMGEKETLEDGLLEIGHGSKLMLIDQSGVIRGLFSAEDNEIKKLLSLASRLQQP